MKQSVTRALMYAGLTTLLVACASAAALLLLCWLTPSVTVVNQSQWPLENIIVQLPSNRLSFDTLQPGQEAQIFYDAKQSDGVYRIQLRRNNLLLTTQCGYITHGEWGKRMQVIIDDGPAIECREQMRY